MKTLLIRQIGEPDQYKTMLRRKAYTSYHQVKHGPTDPADLLTELGTTAVNADNHHYTFRKRRRICAFRNQ